MFVSLVWWIVDQLVLFGGVATDVWLALALGSCAHWVAARMAVAFSRCFGCEGVFGLRRLLRQRLSRRLAAWCGPAGALLWRCSTWFGLVMDGSDALFFPVGCSFRLQGLGFPFFLVF